jgi:uncharacterized protein (DUF1778 family)
MEPIMSSLAPVSVRVSDRERELLEAAATASRTNLSDFIRRRAVEAAEAELTFQSIVTIPDANWRKFEAWAHKPAKAIPALADLAGTRPAWQD